MKKLLWLFAVLTLLCGSALAQNPPIGYIGLFADEERADFCVEGTPLYPVEMWIWCLPSARGQICAEFAICYPTNVIQSNVTWNADLISVSLGDLPSGLSVCFVTCQWDWLWIAHQTLWVTSPEKGRAEICPHPGVGVYQFANCRPGYPTEPCVRFTHLHLNAPWWECVIGTQSSSWGAIKRMVDD